MDRLSPALTGQKFRFGMVPLSHAQELRDGIEDLRRDGLCDPEFHRGRLGDFVYEPPPDFPGAQSIVVIAIPHAKIRVAFEWKGMTHRFVIPPTYLWHLDEREEKGLAAIFASQGYRFEKALLPLKRLAVRSGLGAYGKNNICYIHGSGSYHRLVAFFTDAPCENDPWAGDRTLDRCGRCSSCVDSCPTGAISDERFLLRAERCLTYLNEEKGDFPAWIEPSLHHCLVGCMICQSVCPENAKLQEWTEDLEHFSEAETDLIMRRTPMKKLPGALLDRLARLDIVEYYNVLSRNLGVLFDKEREA